MILTKRLLIKINKNNKKFYLKYFPDIKIDQEIDIPVKYLSKGSSIKIFVKCDICGKEKEISYYSYNQYISNSGYYCCIKCTNHKGKQTNLKKYGVECPNQLESIQEKSKQTCLEKYGVEYISQTKEYKKKYKETSLKKFGVENPNQSEKIKNKKKETSLKNYGVEHPWQSDIIKKNIKQTCLEKYSVEYPSKSEKIREKVKNSNLERYGTEYYHQSNQFRDHQKQKCIEKYGIYPDERNIQFKRYRNKITHLTNKNKYQLLENWDGYDFYDGEYIKDNFNLKISDKNYPSIYHKISVYYGFINNISPEEISKIENLCLTKKTLNSKKTFRLL
jgi:hypothetical protein